MNENFKDKIDSTYTYIEIDKALLKFSKEDLELTDNFKNDVNDAIDSNEPRNFSKIVEEYGQFIPTEVILGGRVYFKGVKSSSESSGGISNEGSANVGVSLFNVKVRGSISKSKKKSNFHNFVVIFRRLYLQLLQRNGKYNLTLLNPILPFLNVKRRNSYIRS